LYNISARALLGKGVEWVQLAATPDPAQGRADETPAKVVRMRGKVRALPVRDVVHRWETLPTPSRTILSGAGSSPAVPRRVFFEKSAEERSGRSIDAGRSMRALRSLRSPSLSHPTRGALAGFNLP
jgi:hypothetical protein